MVIVYYYHMASANNLETVQRMCQGLNLADGQGEDIMISACQDGNLALIEPLMTALPNVYARPGYGCMFATLCEYGHLRAARWLTRTYHDYDYSVVGMDALVGACRKGHIDVVEWLVQTYDTIDIRSSNDYAFICCGTLDMVQWFLNAYPDIDPHVHDDALFSSACSNNNIDIVRWLYENVDDINIHMHNEQCFRSIKRSPDVAKFFVEITENSDIFYYIGDNASYIVTKDVVRHLPGICYESYNVYAIGDTDYKEATNEIDRRFAASRKKSAKN